MHADYVKHMNLSTRGSQVCQIGVMTDLDIITLTQDEDFDFKTITVFLFSKFDRQPFFLATEIK